MTQTTTRSALASLIFASSWLATDTANAQPLVRSALNGTRWVDLVLNDDTLVHDRFAFSTPGGPRYAPNLNVRRRIIANPSVRAMALDFANIRLNPTPANDDRIEWGWYTGAPITRTGLWGPSTVWLSPTASMSGQNPGGLFRFRTGPAISSHLVAGESEEAGYHTTRVGIEGTGTFVPLTLFDLPPHEMVTGVLMATNDFVDLRLPPSTNPVTVAMWLENPDTNRVEIFARCGSLPNSGAFDRRDFTVPTLSNPGVEGAFLDLPVCSSNWFLTVRSTSSVDRVFHLHWGTHFLSREINPETVGISFNATTTELNEIKRAFQEAAWRLYAATDGGYVVRRFQFFNNVGCEAGWPNTPCNGGGCGFCVRPSTTVPCGSWWNGFQVWICHPDRLNPPLIMHEAAHKFIGFRDNYHGVASACPGTNTSFGYIQAKWPLCGHSSMADSLENQNGFCTALGHRTNQLDYRGFSLTNMPTNTTVPPVIDGPVAFDCSGNSFWTNHGDEWGALSGAHVPTTHPSNQSPHNEVLPQLWRRTMIGCSSTFPNTACF